MAQLKSRHVGLNGSTLPEDTVAVLKRYRHGNESDKYSVHGGGALEASTRTGQPAKGCLLNRVGEIWITS